MRWTEIEAHAHAEGIPTPTYRQMDIWSRELHSCGRSRKTVKTDGHAPGCVAVSPRLASAMKGDRHGQFRDWSDVERDVALMVARLARAGLSVDLAFRVARTTPDATGRHRTVVLDEAGKPLVTVSIDGP